MIALMFWRLFRSRGDLLHGDCETVGSGAWRYDEREKRRDGDAMRKRNHVIPVRLNARNSGNWRNRWKKAD